MQESWKAVEMDDYWCIDRMTECFGEPMVKFKPSFHDYDWETTVGDLNQNYALWKIMPQSSKLCLGYNNF